jgi:2-phospho-L-lactate transferase/gluconeogenesis factor (CofD/UPF0052 family)
MGSLYTSIIPNLGLKGMGACIANSNSKKIIMLNGSLDRETGNMTASEIVQAIVDALNMRYTSLETSYSVANFVTDVVAPRNGGIVLDLDKLAQMGVTVHECDSVPAPNAVDSRYYDASAFVDLLARELRSGA